MRHTLKHGAGHTGHHRTTATHHHLSALAREHMAAARKGKHHPHKGHKGSHPHRKKK